DLADLLPRAGRSLARAARPAARRSRDRRARLRPRGGRLAGAGRHRAPRWRGSRGVSGQLERVWRQAAQRGVPIEVMVELTHHCNFRGGPCYRPDFGAPDRLSTGRLLALLDELAAMGTLVLALSGGELFLRRDWFEVARRARQLDFDLHLFSNGYLID